MCTHHTPVVCTHLTPVRVFISLVAHVSCYVRIRSVANDVVSFVYSRDVFDSYARLTFLSFSPRSNRLTSPLMEVLPRYRSKNHTTMVFLLMVLARGSSIQENRIAHWGKGVESSELKNAKLYRKSVVSLRISIWVHTEYLKVFLLDNNLFIIIIIIIIIIHKFHGDTISKQYFRAAVSVSMLLLPVVCAVARQN